MNQAETTSEVAQRGILAFREGRHSDATSDLQAALDRMPEQAGWRVILARSLQALGEIERARSELLQLTSRRDSRPEWQALLATCESRLGRHAIAIDLLQKALEKRPEVDTWRRTLAGLFFRTGRFGEAEPLLITLCVAADAQPYELAQLAQIRRHQRAWRDAVKLFERAIAGAKRVPVAWKAMEAECRRRLEGADAADDQPRNEVTSSYYDELYRGSDAYAAVAEDSDYLPVWDYIIERLAASPGRRTIDIGCGPGQFATLLLSRLPYLSYTGIDFSPVAVEQGRVRCPQGEFVHADIVRSEILGNLEYDTAICTEFLEHVERDLFVLESLKPGVLFLGSVPNFGSFSHVRHFSDAAAVAQRYGHYFSSLTVQPISIGNNRILFVFVGVVGELQEALVIPADSFATDEPINAKRHWSGITFDFYTGRRPWSDDMASFVLGFAPERIFEFGCNAGGNLAAIRTRNATVELHGLDINAAAIKYAVEHGLKGCGLGDETTLAAMPAGSFDVVFTISVLDHLPDPGPTLSHLLRLSRGAVILHEPWLGTEGRVVKNRHRSTDRVIDTTPYSYSWDYEKLCRAVAPHWRLTAEKMPIPTNLGKFYWRYTLTH